MNSLVNINSEIILRGIDKASPLTAIGRVAITNYKSFLQKQAMTATGLEASIHSLTTDKYDAGLENFVHVLKGLMPTAKRKVAVAYEQLQLQTKGTIFYAGVEAQEVLAQLYTYSADKIIKTINEGALKQWEGNPTIASLIAFARAAKQDRNRNDIPQLPEDASVKMRLVPLINIASLGDNGMLIALDDNIFIQGTRGSLTKVDNIDAIENIPSDVRALLASLRVLEIDEKLPSQLTFNSSVMSQLTKTLNVKGFAIDLLAGSSELVVINGTAMSADKAKALLEANRENVIANILNSEEAKNALQLLVSTLEIFDKYRGTLLSNVYSKKFIAGDYTFYVIKSSLGYTVVSLLGNQVINTKAYNTIYEVLADDVLITNVELHNAISVAYASELVAEKGEASVKQELLKKLIAEREQYVNLFKQIQSEKDGLEQEIDANPEKKAALKDIEDKVTKQVELVVAEINKLTGK